MLEKYRKNGIGIRLMDVAEQLARAYGPAVCLGVGLHSGYGGAQRLYAKRGYLPDGSGVWYRDAVCEPYAICRNDDDLILYLSKVFDKDTGRCQEGPPCALKPTYWSRKRKRWRI